MSEKDGVDEEETSAGNEGKTVLSKIKNGCNGPDAPTSINKQGTIWKLDKEFKIVRVERWAGSVSEILKTMVVGIHQMQGSTLKASERESNLITSPF